MSAGVVVLSGGLESGREPCAAVGEVAESVEFAGVSCLISTQRLVQAMEAACRSFGVGLESRIKFAVGHPPGCGLGLADARG